VPTSVCRAKSPEGEFLRLAGIDKHWVTSNGYMSCVSPGGKYLGPTAAKALEAFLKLPEDERKPGAVTVPDLMPSEELIPAPPAGGLVLKVHARFLSADDKGELRYAKPEDFPLMEKSAESRNPWQLFLQPNTEYMWLTREEWRALVPANPVQGEKVAVAPVIVERMARFHLTPRRAMTSEDGIQKKEAIKSARLTLVVEDVSAERIRMVLEGFVHTGTEFDAAQASTPNGPLGFGFATPLRGLLEYDRTKNVFTRFDIAAPGEVWGRWGDANGKSLFAERPGRTPFGFAFEMAQGDSPSNRLPPGGNGQRAETAGYFTRP
jgi:hypothetical protein